MSEPASASPVHVPRIAFALGAALLLGFGAVYLFTLRDNSRREALETVTEPRAVGDERLFSLPKKIAPDQMLVSFEGRKLIAAEKVERRDSRMEKAGLDETRAFFIYRSLDPNDSAFQFVKVGNGKYLKLAPKS